MVKVIRAPRCNKYIRHTILITWQAQQTLSNFLNLIYLDNV